MNKLIPIFLILLISPVLACQTDADCPKLKCPGEESKCINGECYMPKCSLQESLEATGLEKVKEEYNKNLGQVPGIVAKILGSERINFYLSNGEDSVIGVVTKNARILEIQKGEVENPTLFIYITEATIQKLIDKKITLSQALETKEIKIEPQRLRTRVKFWFTRKIVGIAEWFQSKF